NPAQYADGHHRIERVRKIVARVRHDLCRGPAAVRGDSFDLRAPVPRPNGTAGCRFDRRLEPGDLDRTKDHGAPPAMYRGNHYRKLRLPARAVFVDRDSALSGMR